MSGRGRGLFKNILQLTAKGLLLILTVTAGLLVWLRTEAGAKFIFDRLTALEIAEGWRLTASAVEGPFPGRLRLREVVLANTEGPLIRVEKLELELDILALGRGLVHIPYLRITGPELLRFPVLTAASTDLAVPLVWPVEFLADEVILTGGLVRAEAFTSLGLAVPDLTLETTGTVRLVGQRSLLDLSLRLAEVGSGEALNLQAAVKLESGWQRVDKLELTASGLHLNGFGEYRGAKDLTAEAELKVNGVSPWVKTALALAKLNPLDFSGEVDVHIKAGGCLDKLALTIEATSSEISTSQGQLTGLALLGTASRALTVPKEDGEDTASWSGRLDFSVAQSPGGPLTFGSGWGIAWNKSGGLSLVVSDLAGELAGLTLSGRLTAEISETVRYLEGGLTADLTTWDKLAALTGWNLAGGAARLRLELSVPEGRQAALVGLDLASLKTGGSQSNPFLSLAQSSLNFSASDLFGAPNLELNLALGPGLVQGVAFAGGHLKAESRVGAGEGRLRLDRVSLPGIGLGGTVKDFLEAVGKINFNLATAEVNELGLMVGGSGLKLTKPLKLFWGDQLKSGPLEFKLFPAGTLVASVDFPAGRLKATTEIKALPYSFFKPFLGSNFPEGLLHRLVINLNQSNTGYAGDFTLKTIVASRQLGQLKPELNLTGRLEGSTAPLLTITGNISGGSDWPAEGTVTVGWPLSFSSGGSFPWVNFAAPLSARFHFIGPVAPLWRLAGLADRSFKGEARVELALDGPLSRLQPQGDIYLAGGCYEDNILGLLFTDIMLEAHISPGTPVTAIVSARDGQEGRLIVNAEMSSLKNGFLKASGGLSAFNLLHRDDLSLRLSGRLTAEGPLDRLSIGSDLTVDEGELNLEIALAGASIPTLNLSDPNEQAAIPVEGQQTRLALKLNVPGQFFIRGYGLDSEWRGDLTIGGSSRSPSLIGVLRPVRGYYETPIFSSKQFVFSKGEITFSGGVIPNLNLELTNQGPNIIAVIRAVGPARSPDIKLESRPPLPQEEVLAQVLFGKNATSLSRFEAVQLAGALKELTGFGGKTLLNSLTAVCGAFGLDFLHLGSSVSFNERRTSDQTGSLAHDQSARQGGVDQNEADVSLKAGKYLRDNVYIGVEQGISGGSAVRMEVELAPSVSLEASTSSESSRVGLGWKKDY
ncbi:MAG: translocation/assembly module TamB [Candidatus Adiutrix intracellularis]|jgi:translocation and assembly module TamB|nr:translocation/assembly module TamB [Candidatus Adiutrix intracellularis]